MPTIHDPYLSSVKRTLEEEKIKQRRDTPQKINKKESFFSKEIIISNYIYLPESLQNSFLITIFIFVPYLLGLIIILFINPNIINNYISFDLKSFMFSWTIGYEFIALLILTAIMKSAFTFKKNTLF